MVAQSPIAELEADALASMAPIATNTQHEWHPDLNETQQKIFDDSSRFILGYGEKGSGAISD